MLTVARHDPLGYDIRAELFGSEDSVSVGLGPRTPMRSVEPGVPPPAGPAWKDFLIRFESAYAAEFVAFVAMARGEAPSPCTAQDGVAALRIAEAATRSLHEHRPVRLEEIPAEGPEEGGVHGGPRWPRRTSVPQARPSGGTTNGSVVSATDQRRRTNRMNLRTRTLAALAGAAIIAGPATRRPRAASGDGGGLDGALVKRADIKIEIVTHGQAQDRFWASSATASRPAPPTWA